MLPDIQADPDRIRQVLFNLLFNGLRHTPPGGKITLEGTADDQGICVSVTDTGEGLDPEQLSSVFDRFYRGDKSRSRETGGSGLGLAIVKAIVEAHGGRVEVHSPGKGLGSTFTVYFPYQRIIPYSRHLREFDSKCNNGTHFHRGSCFFVTLSHIQSRRVSRYIAIYKDLT